MAAEELPVPTISEAETPRDGACSAGGAVMADGSAATDKTLLFGFLIFTRFARALALQPCVSGGQGCHNGRQ
jgi:hypothetical protein